MTEYLSEVINPDEPGSFMKDTKENTKVVRLFLEILKYTHIHLTYI